MKCDRLSHEGTCGNEHLDPSGLCSAHRGMPGSTLRDLQAEKEKLRNALRALLDHHDAHCQRCSGPRGIHQAALTADQVLAGKACRRHRPGLTSLRFAMMGASMMLACSGGSTPTMEPPPPGCGSWIGTAPGVCGPGEQQLKCPVAEVQALPDGCTILGQDPASTVLCCASPGPLSDVRHRPGP